MELEEALNNPNNILGIEYLKAIYKLKCPLKALTIARKDSGYHDQRIEGRIASATAIRKTLLEEGIDDRHLIASLPKESLSLLKMELDKREPVQLKSFSQSLLVLLRRLSREELATILGVGEGLENRLQQKAREATTLNQLLTAVKTKRYTWTRLQRILIHLLLDYKSVDAAYFDRAGGPCYLRLLGFNSTGRRLLNIIKKRATLPLITRVADYYRYSSGPGARMLELDLRATDLYRLAYRQAEDRLGGEDFLRKPVILQ